MKLCFFLKDTDTIIAPGPGGRCTRNRRVRKQSDSVLNMLQWNLSKIFTQEEATEFKRVEKL